MSATAASKHLCEMVEIETRGHGDTDNALRRICTRYGIPYWPAWHLRQKRAKTIDSDFKATVRDAYLRFLEDKIAALHHKLVIEREKGADDMDPDLGSIEADAARLLEKIAAARAKGAA